MKQLGLALGIAVLMAGCSGGKSTKTAQTIPISLTFNGFVIGTPLDTLAKRVPAKPVLQTDNELNFRDVLAEGIRWNTITYDFVGGKLARVTAMRSGQNTASYQELYQRFTTRYGKPGRSVDSLTIWARWDAELSIQPGSLLFARR